MGHNPMALYAFVMTVIAAALTAFYSWRLIFMTFHGSPHDQHHYEAAHESPLVILVPLGFLAAGSLLAGFPFKEALRRPRRGGVLPRVRSSSGSATTSSRTCTRCPTWIALAPDRDDGDRLRSSPGSSTSGGRSCRPSSRASTQPLYHFLLNKWYFDELYDFLVRAPGALARPRAVEGRRRPVIDGFGPDGISARVLDVTRNVVRLQTGYLYHYAFAMLIGVAALITWFMFGGRQADVELADPLRHHLPAAGRRAVHHDDARRRRSGASATRAGSRCGPR